MYSAERLTNITAVVLKDCASIDVELASLNKRLLSISEQSEKFQQSTCEKQLAAAKAICKTCKAEDFRSKKNIITSIQERRKTIEHTLSKIQGTLESTYAIVQSIN